MPGPAPDLGEILGRFPRVRTWLLPAHSAAQETPGHLPEPALAQVAARLRVPFRVSPGTGGIVAAPGGRARERAEAIQLASLCGLGQAAPQALLRARETFPAAVTARA